MLAKLTDEFGKKYTLGDDGLWKCENKVTQRWLNDQYRSKGSPVYPIPGDDVINTVAELLNAVSIERPVYLPPEEVPGRIY